jgi:hypothetical protein
VVPVPLPQVGGQVNLDITDGFLTVDLYHHVLKIAPAACAHPAWTDDLDPATGVVVETRQTTR